MRGETPAPRGRAPSFILGFTPVRLPPGGGQEEGWAAGWSHFSSTYLKRDDWRLWRLLPRREGGSGALQAGSTSSCCPSTSSCGSFPGVSGLQAKGVGRSPTVGRGGQMGHLRARYIAAQAALSYWEHVRAKRILSWAPGCVFGREPWGLVGDEG